MDKKKKIKYITALTIKTKSMTTWHEPDRELNERENSSIVKLAIYKRGSVLLTKKKIGVRFLCEIWLSDDIMTDMLYYQGWNDNPTNWGGIEIEIKALTNLLLNQAHILCSNKFKIYLVLRIHLWRKFGENPNEKEMDLYFVEISINHPIRRPRAPITITRTILEDLHILV